MRLRFKEKDAGTGGELVCGVTWGPGNVLISAGDDCHVQRWSSSAEPLGKIGTLPAAPSALAFPSAQGGAQQGGTSGADDVFVAALTDGTVVLMNSGSGRSEKVFMAHKGAATCLCWDPDGVAFATGGEDGEVKVWSRAGMLRATLHRGVEPVYAVAFGPDASRLAFSSGSTISVVSVEGTGVPLSWKAHDGVVLALSWNPITGRIASAGEDCRFRIWDPLGAPLGRSPEMTHVVSAVAWNPQGDLLAVGSFNTCLLCDASGNVLSKQRASAVGSVTGLSWTPGGTLFAGGGGSGAVCLGEVVGISVEDRGVVATLEEPNRVRAVYIDADGNATEEALEYRDRVESLSAGYGHVVVATATQCYVYGAGRWGSPAIVDTKGSVLFVRQAEKCFLTVDAVLGLRVLSYEGRQLSLPKAEGGGPGQFVKACVSLSNDTLAVVTRKKPSTVQLLDAISGRAAAQPIEHSAPIAAIGLSQGGTAADRTVFVLDAAGDLLVSLVNRSRLLKLASVVSSAHWHAEQGALAAAVDGVLTVWWHPRSAFLDRDLLDKAKASFDAVPLGRWARITSFKGSRVALSGIEGISQEMDVGPFAVRLHAMAAQGKWAECMRLCRFARDDSLWAALAGLALGQRELSTAEMAYAAVQAADRVEFIQHLRGIPTEEGRNAELAVFSGDFDAGEDMLLRAGLVWRAVDLNMAMFKWSRALELAVAHKTHLDTVLLRRQQYLEAAGLEESDGQFLQYHGKVPLDPENIEAKVRQEILEEGAREGARPYQPPPVATA